MRHLSRYNLAQCDHVPDDARAIDLLRGYGAHSQIVPPQTSTMLARVLILYNVERGSSSHSVWLDAAYIFAHIISHQRTAPGHRGVYIVEIIRKTSTLRESPTASIPGYPSYPKHYPTLRYFPPSSPPPHDCLPPQHLMDHIHIPGILCGNGTRRIHLVICVPGISLPFFVYCPLVPTHPYTHSRYSPLAGIYFPRCFA